MVQFSGCSMILGKICNFSCLRQRLCWSCGFKRCTSVPIGLKNLERLDQKKIKLRLYYSVNVLGRCPEML